MKILCVVALASIGAALLPAAASAATTVSVENRELRVAGDGARSVVGLSLDGSELVVRRTGGIDAGAGCRRAAASEVRCPRSSVDRITAALDGGNDRLRLELPPGAPPVAYSGGTGTDTAQYLLPTDPRATGVGVTLDDLPDDGFAGSGDNVGADVERAQGAAGEDRLSGNDGPNRLTGGFGEDLLRGGAGDDRIVSVDVGRCPSDALACSGTPDTVECGPGYDTVDGDFADEIAADCEMIARQGSVFGTTGADRIVGFRPALTISGRAGDDRITGRGSDSLGGGSGNDVLRAGSRRSGRLSGSNTLFGGSGNDVIIGSRLRDFVSAGKGHDRIRTGAGRDEIQGLAGRDRISAGRGNDRIVAKDRGAERDRVSCGPGRDLVVVDSRDSVSRDCERKTRIDPRYGRSRGR